MYSNYNIFLENIPEEGYTTIYNLYTKNMICLKNDMVYDQSYSERVKNKMKALGIIVEDEAAETKKVVADFENVINDKKTLNITLVLTGKCNCHCVYCYENEFDLSFNKYENVSDTIAIIEEKMKDYSKLVVTFFGGEPLLCKDAIDLFSHIFHKKYGNKYKFAVITNATLLNKIDTQRWQKLGLTCLKITLDGNHESHNRRRPLKNNEDSYEKILSNLADISGLEKIEIIIVIVVDPLIEGISEMIEAVKNIGIEAQYCISIREPDNYSIIEKSNILLDCASNIKATGSFQFSKIATNHGDICCGKMKNTYIIDGVGNVYSCTGMLNKPLGNIKEGLHKNNGFIKDKCMKCKYLPICYGDCLFINKCEKDYFDYFVPKWLALFIQ